MKPWIDFRSDTVTNPTSEMREAMFHATVGDDVYEDDPTVAELESYAAKLIGKEAALFVPTGTFGNLLALYTHCTRGDEVIVGNDCHMARYGTSLSPMAPLVKLRTIDTKKGMLSLDRVGNAIRRTGDIHYPKTGLICLENAHSNGYVLKSDYMNEIGELARNYGVPIHLDGARLFNAAVCLEVDAAELTQQANSVMFCLSKGLCAPVGSILAGTKEFIAKARKNRQQLGGGMRQVGILAAAGLVALQTMRDELYNDHILAQKLAEEIAEIATVKVHMDKTNINMVFCELPNIDAGELVHYLWTNYKIKVLMPENNIWRFVLHNNIEFADVQLLVTAIREFYVLSTGDNKIEVQELKSDSGSIEKGLSEATNTEYLSDAKVVEDGAIHKLFSAGDTAGNVELDYVNDEEEHLPIEDLDSDLVNVIEGKTDDYNLAVPDNSATNTAETDDYFLGHEQELEDDSEEVTNENGDFSLNNNRLRIPTRFKMVPFSDLEVATTKITDFSFTSKDDTNNDFPITADEVIVNNNIDGGTDFVPGSIKIGNSPILAELLDLPNDGNTLLDPVDIKDINSDENIRTRGEARKRREALRNRQEHVGENKKYYWQNKLNKIENQAKIIETICLTENPINDDIVEEIIKGENLIEDIVAETKSVSEITVEDSAPVNIFKSFKVSSPNLLSSYSHVRENFNFKNLQKRREKSVGTLNDGNFSRIPDDFKIEAESYSPDKKLDTNITLDLRTGNPLDNDTDLETFITTNVPNIIETIDKVDASSDEATKELKEVKDLANVESKYNSLSDILTLRKHINSQDEEEDDLEKTITNRKEVVSVNEDEDTPVVFGEEDSVTLDELLSKNNDN